MKERKVAAIDVGSSSVKVLEISINSERPRLEAIGSRKMRSSSKEMSREAIRALLADIGLSKKEANISVSGSHVLMRIIVMPRMKDEELKSAVRFEAEKFIPFNINDYIIDFQVIARDDRENKVKVLLAAAKRAHVEEKVHLLEECGIAVSLVDVDCFALANVFLKTVGAPDAGKTVAILNIGASTSNLSIMKGPELCLARDMAVGGNNFDSAIAKNLNMDIVAAQELKISPGDRMGDVQAALKSAFLILLEEVKHSCNYYENQEGRGIDEILLSGGGSEVAGIAETLEEGLGLKPKRIDPLQWLEAKPDSKNAGILAKSKNEYAVAAGLALR